ncbi:MAG: 4Fe-4S dicluster domain-containing protein [Eggerthellaceae bacterium]
MYFLPISCQHCENPECVKVCPTEAAARGRGRLHPDRQEKCIGCQFCVMACPYGAATSTRRRRSSRSARCASRSCRRASCPSAVSQCGGNARWIGDTEAGYESFEGLRTRWASAARWWSSWSRSPTLTCTSCRIVGNKPSYSYILRDHHWEGGDE